MTAPTEQTEAIVNAALSAVGFLPHAAGCQHLAGGKCDCPLSDLAAALFGVTTKERSMSVNRCPRCDSPQPHLHPAVQHEGEVSICPDAFHAAAVSP